MTFPATSRAQGTLEDYRRAAALNERYRGLVVNVPEAPTWVGETNRFWYRRSVAGGSDFVLVDAATREKRPAFDHAQLAAALSAETDSTFTAVTLPFTTFTFTSDAQAIEFAALQSRWRCGVREYRCTRLGSAQGGGRGGRGGGPARGADTQEETERKSPDERWEAGIQNFNVAIRPAGTNEWALLSHDGSEGDAYSFASISWSPDSRKIAAYRVKPGYRRVVHYIESSRSDQLQPKHSEQVYPKPGDVLDVQQPVLFDVETRRQLVVDNALFPNPYGLSRFEWRKYRINFDGSGLVAFTEAEGDHNVSFSPDRQYYVDSWSRVDLPPIAQLRRTSDRSVIMELERAHAGALLATGWKPPEVFVAKGRDGKTDIWGVILRPTNFDPAKTYPVIENIYAVPQGSFVPKTFSTQAGRQALAELGFIVVHIDGMGTSNRSKPFHNVAWRNLGDAGFPDRVLWHKAVAAKYPYYDTSRVGIYGTSAGGQNAMGALLFHPEFYDVAVSAAGCHDNRMDKIRWNEHWMGWPLAPHYEASSNMVNAHKLEGKLLFVVGEMDTNVDPSSTLQVVNALIKAEKSFDLLFLPGAGHTNGGAYGSRVRNDFFVQHLLAVTPPDWNAGATLSADAQDGSTLDFPDLDEDLAPSFFDYSDDFRWWAR